MEFENQPDKCAKAYRMIALRKRISVEAVQDKLFEEYRYFFYITNDTTSTAKQIVMLANDRCDQENLIEQLKNGVRAMRNPLDNLYSNWTYMVCCTLAWNLKVGCGLLPPVTPGRHEPLHRDQKWALLRMEVKRFPTLCGQHRGGEALPAAEVLAGWCSIVPVPPAIGP